MRIKYFKQQLIAGLRAIIIIFFILFFTHKGKSQLTFTITNPSGNYDITCTNTVINLFASSDYSSTVSYTWANLPLGSSVAGNSIAAISSGTYIVIAASGTISAIPQVIVVGINTVAPTISVSSTQSVLSCEDSTLQLLATSSSTNTSYLWSFPTGTVTTNSLIATANFSISPSVNPLIVYTLVATDVVNQCQSNTIITVYQNIFPPNAAITASSNSLTCLTSSIQLNNNSTPSIPTTSVFPNNQAVIVSAWFDPPPSISPMPNNSLSAFAAGTYTIVVKDLNNGCTSSSTINIGDNRIYPIITAPNIYTVGCPNGTVDIAPLITGGNLADMSFLWTIPIGANTTNTNASSLVTDASGVYKLIVTNTMNGCKTQSIINVWACVGLNENVLSSIKLSPNPTKDLLNLEYEQGNFNLTQLTINNTFGQTVFTLNNIQSQQVLDLSFLQAGVYFLSLQNNERQKTFKIIKE